MRFGPVFLFVLTLLAVGAAADTFSFSGDRTEVVLAEGRERTLLTGNAVVESDDVLIRADSIELYGDDFRYAQCSGGVYAETHTNGVMVTADSFFYDRETDTSRAEGDVAVDDPENELVVKAGYLESRDDGNILQAQISVRVFQDDLTARAQFLRYRREEDTLELSGFPVVYWKGDEYRATRIVLNLETEEIELQGRVQGSIVIEDDEGEEVPSEDGEAPEVTDTISDSDDGLVTPEDAPTPETTDE